MPYTVFYLNPEATQDVADIVRHRMPGGWRLLVSKPNEEVFGPLQECDFILVADHPITKEHLAAAPKLKMIQHQGVGYERIDIEACRTHGIPVALTPEGTTVGVAEHTILLILAVYKKLMTACNAVRRGGWPQWELRTTSFEIYGKRLGLVGLGRIGREVAVRALAFGAEVQYYDDVVPQPSSLDLAKVSTLEELLTTSDIVSLHVPVTASTRRLIRASTLAMLKSGAILINTARGSLIDETDLVAALRTGCLAGAGLDVLVQEPPSHDNPLLSMENVVLTPHIAAGTIDALRTKMDFAIGNLVCFTRGEPLRHVVPELTSYVPMGCKPG